MKKKDQNAGIMLCLTLRQKLTKLSAVILILLSGIFSTNAQVAINTNDAAANANAALDIQCDQTGSPLSHPKGVLFPNLSQTDINNLPSPATGLLVYNRTVGYFNYYNGTKWCTINRSATPVCAGSSTNQGTTKDNEIGVGIGIEDPDNSAILHVNANNKGVLIPRLAVNPAMVQGMIYYNTAGNNLVYYNNTKYIAVNFTLAGAASSATGTAEGVVIGNTAINASAKFQIDATNKGLLIPRMTDADRNNIKSVAEGLLIYNTTSNTFQYYVDNSWYSWSIISSSQSFTSAVSNQSWSIPAGVYNIQIKVWGAGGGGANSTSVGGGGGYATGYLDVVPGQTIYVSVGGGGTYNSSGGLNGGGTAGTGGGGAGGGASDIRVGGTAVGNRILVAGGGGGGGYTSNAANGGAGGGTNGANGVAYSGCGSSMGYGGTQAAGGAHGTYCSSSYGSTAGDNSGVGIGGIGAPGYSSGGGGGGYHGGGGAEPYAGGGGGSSYIGGVTSGGSTTSGSGQNAGNNADADYSGSAGTGGAVASAGKTGLIVIKW